MATWKERLRAAKEAGAFTEDDESDASSWSSCYVGERYDLKPSHDSEIVAQYGQRIWHLGRDFDDAVDAGEIDRAMAIADDLDLAFAERDAHAQSHE